MVRGRVWARKYKSKPLDQGEQSVSYPETSCRIRYRIEVQCDGLDGDTVVADGCSDQVSVRSANGGSSGSVRIRVSW